VLVALVLYSPTVGHGFVHDDRVLIEGSTRLAELSQLPAALVHDLFWLAGGEVRPSPYWRPWVVLSYYIDWLVGAGSPWAFHLHNVALAAVVGGVLGWTRGAAGVVAAVVFLAHPMQVEAIANVTARTDLWVAAWGTLAVLTGGLPGAALTAVALGCKETAVVVPVIAWLGAPSGPAGRHRWLPHAVTVGLWAVVRTLLVAGWGVAAVDRGGPTLTSVLQAPGVWLDDLGRLLLPVGSTLARLPTVPGVAQVVAGVVLVAVVVAAMTRARPALRRDLGLVVLPLVPVSGLLASPVRYAEGFLSWPLLGLSLLSLRLPARARVALVLVALLAWAPLTVLRVPEWASSRSIWEAAHAAHPADPRAALGLARVVSETEPERARTLAQLATEAEPDPRKNREAHALLAHLLVEAGEDAAARPHLVAATAASGLRDPEGEWARTARCVLGADQEPPAALEPVCGAALVDRPGDADLWNAAGLVAVRGGHLGMATVRFRRAAELAPDREEFRANAARAEALHSAP
jgi:hypothetical protein